MDQRDDVTLSDRFLCRQAAALDGCGQTGRRSTGWDFGESVFVRTTGGVSRGTQECRKCHFKLLFQPVLSFCLSSSI